MILEIRDYELAQAPPLAMRVRRNFAASLSALQTAADGTLLAAVAFWMPLALVALGAVYRFGRRGKGG
ncbi:MAG: hypothetical protein DWQ37_09770 [Planctomycetota bacterium]|nr:MAG: hypothetical protein DWQ37_09770 [Planctomycetota bacterium]